MKRKAEQGLEDEATRNTNAMEVSEGTDDEEDDQEIGETNPKVSKVNVKQSEKKNVTPGGLLRPVKLSKSELYKPPTNEELNQLKETENLFHSNLLRMQIEELLNEVKLKEKKRKSIDSFLHEINTLLGNIPETKGTDETQKCSNNV